MIPASILPSKLHNSLPVYATLIAIMLIEIWERLRGYDKWIQTEAVIKSSELGAVPFAANSGEKAQKPAGAAVKEWRSTCTIAWTDGEKQAHTAQFEVSDNSPLFQLYEGNTVSIRYDPVKPGEFYLPGVLKSRILSGVKWTVFNIVVFGIVLFIFLLH